jgi:hypothetical protein
MTKLFTAFALLICVAACTTTNSQYDSPPVDEKYVLPAWVDENYLVGTWVEFNNPSHKEVFLSSKEYCRYEGPKVVATGSWFGLVELHITDSLNPNEISREETVIANDIRPLDQNKYAERISCDHCGTSLGTVYLRSTKPITSCGKVARSDP